MRSILLCVQLGRNGTYNVVSYKNGDRSGGLDISGHYWSYPDTFWFSNAKLEFLL